MGDMFRFVTVLLGLVAASQFPGILSTRVHGWRMWLVVVAVEVLLLSAIGAVLAHLGDHVRWYRAPALFLASLAVLVYVLSGTRFWARLVARWQARRS